MDSQLWRKINQGMKVPDGERTGVLLHKMAFEQMPERRVFGYLEGDTGHFKVLLQFIS